MSEPVLDFLVAIARATSSFRRLQIEWVQSGKFGKVDMQVIPFCPSGATTNIPEGIELGATLEISLSGNLKQTLDSDQKSLGLSILIRRKGSMWQADGEIGYSGDSIGWDPFRSTEISGVTIAELCEQLPGFADCLVKDGRDKSAVVA